MESESCKRCGGAWRPDKIEPRTGVCPNCLRAIGRPSFVDQATFNLYVAQAKDTDCFDEPEIAQACAGWDLVETFVRIGVNRSYCDTTPGGLAAYRREVAGDMRVILRAAGLVG